MFLLNELHFEILRITPQAQLVALQAALEAAEKRAHDGELIRRKLHNTIQELKGNIRVFCRVRPVSSAEQVGITSTLQR